MFGHCRGIVANGQRVLDSRGAADRTNPSRPGPMDHPLVFAASPSNDIGIDPFQGWTQLRRIEVAVVVDPAPDARVVHRGQIAEDLSLR